MIIRTISQLPRELEDIENDSLFELSKKVDDRYISKSVEFNTLQKQVAATAVEQTGITYGLIDGKNNIDVSKLKEVVDALKSGDLVCSGNKELNGDLSVIPGPTYTKDVPDADLYKVANVKYVQEAITNLNTFVGSKSNYTAGIAADGTIYNPEQMLKCYFDNDDMQTNEVKMTKTGNLVMYGWLADNGNVDTAAAWVALEGCIIGENNSETWLILQLQPWILGEKHENLQYVGFNCPVTEGMKIRVKTGFTLNYTNSTYQNRKNSLVKNNLIPGTNLTNAFLGYVIY